MVDPAEFRRCLGRFATGVTVVTTRSQDGGVLHAMTVNTLTSVSLNPPLVLFCASNQTRTLEIILESRVYAVNILSEEQKDLSDRFAGFGADEEDRFGGIDYTLALDSRCPIFPGCLGSLDCRLVDAYPGGDHQILVAEVVALSSTEGRPLLFYSSTYPRLE
ncbi:MAG: flavin reductase family protein [Armatimonadetes bacterium]|nr:flavin reductase family protein [Armatimonadota bacterium]